MEAGGRSRGTCWTEGRGSAGCAEHGYSRNDERLFSVVRCEGGVAGDGEGRCSQIKEDLGPMSGWVLMFSPVQGGMPVKYFEQRKWLGHVCFLERSVQCPQEDRCQGG